MLFSAHTDGKLHMVTFIFPIFPSVGTQNSVCMHVVYRLHGHKIAYSWTYSPSLQMEETPTFANCADWKVLQNTTIKTKIVVLNKR